MKHPQRSVTILAISALLTLAGCSSSGGLLSSTGLVPSVSGLFGKAPGDVVKAAMTAANAQNYPEADKYLAAPVQKFLQSGFGAALGGSKGFWDRFTKNATIDKVEILREDVQGDAAHVSTRFHYKDGSTFDQDLAMAKQNGDWKIALSD